MPKFISSKLCLLVSFPLASFLLESSEIPCSDSSHCRKGPSVPTSSYSYSKRFSHTELLISRVPCSRGQHVSHLPTTLYLLWLCCAARLGTMEKSSALPDGFHCLMDFTAWTHDRQCLISVTRNLIVLDREKHKWTCGASESWHF